MRPPPPSAQPLAPGGQYQRATGDAGHQRATGDAGHQRATGATRLEFALGPRGTALARLYQQAPLRVLFPTPEPGEPPTAALVNCAGGLAGGDSLATEALLGAGCTATLSTPAAEKVYRSLGPLTRVTTRLQLEAGATLEWLPQETILFDQARLARRMDVHLGAGARLLGAEMLVFGRSARGETMRAGMVRDSWRLHGPAGLLWADGLALDEELGGRLAAPLGFAGAEAMATLLLAAPGAEAHLPLLRAALEGTRGAAANPEPPGAAPFSAPPGAATTPRPGLLLARFLGDALAVRDALAAGIVALRHAALGQPARLPRLWTT
jgi:urease accessory protein